MSSDFYARDDLVERGPIPLDIDNVHMLLQVEQEQIQKKTFTNWVNAQLAKRRPPCMVRDLFSDFCDGSRLLDLLEVMSGQRLSRERGRGMFQHRSNIERALSFLKQKSIKLVNIHIPDIMDGKPSIILGLIWTIILQYHIEELASCLNFSSRQSSMESLNTLDSRSSLSSRSASSSPVPPRGSPLHNKFRVSAKKALLLWVREQCHKAGCTLNVKDFKSSWRSGVIFLAILYALRPDLVDLSKARTRSNRQNLEEAFHIAERELRIPRLLDPDDVDVRDPDEKSIMTYVAQFLQYSRDLPVPEEEMQTQYLNLPKSPSPVNLPVHYTPAISASPLRQATPERKAQEVTCWLAQAYDELLEGWNSTEGESYSERYHVFQTFLVSFNEQRRPIMPLLTQMRRTPKLSDEQRALREAWDTLTEKLREYKIELDMSLPAPLDTVARWLLKTEGALAEEEGDPQDHGRAADDAREKQELLKVCLEEMPQHTKTFQSFQNLDEYGNMMVPIDKMDELKRRFTGVRVSAKYHGIRLDYREHRHTVMDLLGQIRTKLRVWKRPYISPEAVRVLLQEWHELVNTQELPSLLETALHKLKQDSEKYASKSALAGDYNQVSQQVKQLEEQTAVILEEVKTSKSTMGRVLSAWDSYSDCHSSLQAWLEQGSLTHTHGQRTEVTPESMAEWGSRQAHMNEVGNFLIESTDPQTSKSLAEELRRLNMQWAEFVKKNTFDGMAEPSGDVQVTPQDVQALIREATLLLKEPFIMRKVKEVDLEALTPSPECPADQVQKLKLAVPEVMQTLFEAEQVCAELQHSVSGLDSRLAELLHWETEAREMYHLLRASERQQQRGQDPRARVLISRGLQLEGQVVTEEQDLQVMVMTNQKSSPIQYLHATTMQERVRAAVAQSQEAVGMLSSLGARRDRSRSPPDGTPPSKVFIQARGKPQQLRQSEDMQPSQGMKILTQQSHETFVPKIVVQEYKEIKVPSPPMPYTYAQALMGTKSSSEGTVHVLSETYVQKQLPPQEQESVQIRQIVKEVHDQDVKTQPQEMQQQETMPTQPQQQQLEQQKQEMQVRLQQHVAEQPQRPESQQEKVQVEQQQRVESLQQQQQYDKQQKQQEQMLQQQKHTQQKQPQPTVKQVEPDSDTKAKPQSVSMAQPHPQTKVQHKPPPQTVTESDTQSVKSTSSQIHAQSIAQSQSHIQPVPQSHPQSFVQVQTTAQLRGQPQTHPQTMTQSMVQTQTHAPLLAQPSPAQPSTQQTQSQLIIRPQGHPQPMNQYPLNVQPVVQHPGPMSQSPIPTWTQVRASSPMPIPHPQGPAQVPPYPQGYPQGHSPSQQWTPKQEPQNTAIAQQRHPIPQPHPQQMGQSPQSQAYPTGQVPQQWSQAAPQLMQQIRHPGYPPMGPSFGQAQMQQQTQTQPWTHTQPQSLMQQQQPRMRAAFPPQQSQIQQQTWGQAPLQPQPQSYPPPHLPPQSQQYPQLQTQRHPQPQIQAQVPTQLPQPHQVPPQRPSQPQLRPQLQAQTQGQIQIQPSVQVNPQVQTQQSQFSLQFQQPPQQPKSQAQLQPQQVIQPPTQSKSDWAPQPHPSAPFPPQQGVQPSGPPKVQSPTQPKSDWAPQPKPLAQLPPQQGVQPSGQPKIQSTTQTKSEQAIQQQPKSELPIKADSQPQSRLQSETVLPTEAQLPTLPKVQSPTQPKPQAQLPPQPQLQDQSATLPKNQTAVQSMAQSPPQSRPQTQPPPQPKPQTQPPPQPKPQQPQTVSYSQVTVLPQTQAESPDVCIKPPALAQAPPQAYTEAYAKAQALARNGFEEAKYCLQEHIMETINIFQDKRLSAEQVSVKEETLRTLDPELLEEFLRAAEGMEAFCTPAELRDMEFYTQSVRSQWEAVRAEISGYLQQLRFELTRKDFNKAALQCETLLNSPLENQAQACVSEDASFAQAGQHLQALKELCDTLSPEDAHRLAQTQLRECEKRLAAIQRQFSGDQDAPLPDSRIAVAFGEDLNTQKEPARPSDKPQASAEVVPVTMKTVSVERKEVEKQTSADEEVTKKDAPERYETSKRTLQAQLAKNEQSLKDVPSDSVSLKGLHTRLQEIQFLRQETESLWSDYSNQCSQCGNPGLEQEKAELQEQWRSQQSALQKRGSSLGAALRQIDSTENHMVDFTDRLDRYLRQPKHITGFTLANTNIIKDIKELDDNIQSELDQLSRLDSESSDLDPKDCLPLSREVETHKASLDQLRQQVRKSEAAARALDRFLMSLRTVDEDISGVQGAPCSDSQVLQDCRSKLGLIRQSIDSLKEKAPQLDQLLQGARLTVTRDGVPASCLDMVTALVRRLEDADNGLANQQKGIQKETQGRSLGLRKRTLVGDLRKLQETIEAQGLKEPTMPAVQHRLRALSDLDSQVQSQQAELQKLRELQEKEGGGEDLFQELEAQWKETQKAFIEGKKQCNVLLDNLKKFQSCRSRLSSTMQKAEQTMGEQASYMGKDNLQRSITKVGEIKEELAGLGEPMEEMRGVCRQLQAQLKKFPDCSEAPFEAEAHTLMDNWLDVTEKTDAYMDNLQVGLELWEKQLIVGAEVDGWAGSKLALFAESHPFHNEQQVLTMRDEINANEENIELFHKKSVEIQEMLQGQEAPLELQVMETQLRKRMQQVKELFTDCTDVFEELVAVKTHLAEKIDECQAAVQSLQCSLSNVDATQPKVEDEIQDLCDELETQEEQAEAVLKEVSLVSSVASPQVLEALSVDCSRLREAISRTKDMIHLKREERDKGLLKVIKDEKQTFIGWFQDLQMSVNECFENPESKTHVETSLQRLTGFLKAKDEERRLDQLKDQLEKGSRKVPPQQLSEFNDWLKEQQEEVETFRTHCLNRQEQMEALLGDLNSLQKHHDSFRDWLQIKEKQSVEPDKAQRLLKNLQDESGKVDSLSELLASVRKQGVRAESLLKDGDNLIQRYKNLEAKLQKKVDTQSALRGEVDKFDTQAKSTKSWITDLLQPLKTPDRDAKTEEMKKKAQAVLNSKPEGDSKVNDLKKQSERLCELEDMEEKKKQEVQQSVRETEEQWRAALQTAEQTLNKAETQDLLDKDCDAFKTKNEEVQSWIGDQEQTLQSLGGCMQVEEKIPIVQAILDSKPDGDSKLQDLKQQCQKMCDNQACNDNKRREVQDTVRKTEEQWNKVLQAAQQALDKTGTEAAAEKDFDAFKTQSEGIQSWIREQKQKLLSPGSQMPFEERLQVAQATMRSKPEGESKLLDLKKQGDSLCERLEESRKPEVQQLVKDTEQQWRNVLQAARQAELRALSEDFDCQSKNTQSWIRDRQQKLQTVGSQTPAQERSNMAQTILSCKPEGDSKLTELRRLSQSLSDQEDLEENTKVEAQKTLKDSEKQWETVLQSAENTLKKAEVQYSLSKELEAFGTQAGSTKSWVEDLQKQAKSIGSGTQGSRAQLEDRLNAAQVILNSKSIGEARINALKRRAESLSKQKDLDGDKKKEVQKTIKDAEEQWRTSLKAAEDSQRQLRGVLDRLASFENQRDQAEARLSDVKKQAAAMSREFPWPGLGERRQVLERTRALLDQSSALAPVFSDLRKQSAELFEITKDPALSDPSLAAKQESIPALLKELTEVLPGLEQGIQTERQCTQLVEQHEAAQDWLREHVKGLGAPPTDRPGLHSTINTLKALLQTADREKKEMKELDSARDSLLNLCTPGGKAALTLEVGHLHDLCNTSEQEVKNRLTACETRLAELDGQAAKKAQGLKERAAALQWELRSLDQALSYSEPQDNIAQLQQHWNSLKKCEKSLRDLGVKVQDLNEDVKSTPVADELPGEITTMVESLRQQQDSLKSRLGEHKGTCSTNTTRCLMDCLHTLQEWNQSEPAESSSSAKATLEEGEKLKANLQESLSHRQFLTDCLIPELFVKLEKDGSETLKKADAQKASLVQNLKTKIEPEMVKTESTQRLLVEEVRNVGAVMLDDSEPVLTAQTKGDTGSLQTPAPITEAGAEQLKPASKMEESKSPKVSATTEPVGTRTAEKVAKLELTQKEVKVERPSMEKSELDQELTEAAVLERCEVLPPKRKSKTVSTKPSQADQQAEKMTKEPDTSKSASSLMEETGTKLVPTKRQDEKTEPDGLKSSSVQQVVTEPTETVIVKETKLSPTKRRSKDLKIPPEPSSEKVAEVKQEPESQKPSLSHRAPSETIVVEEIKKVATIILDAPETLSSENAQKQAEVAVLLQEKLVPPKRKSKGSDPSPKQAESEEPQTRTKHEEEKPSFSSTIVTEEAKLVAARRKSKNGDTTTTSVTDEANKQNKKESGPQKFSAAEKGKTSPTKPRIDSRSLSLDFVTEEEPASQQSSVQPGTLTQKDKKPMPLRKKSRSVDLPSPSEAESVSIQPAQNIASEKGKTSPTKPRIDSRSLSLDFVFEEESASQQSSVQPGTLTQKDKKPMPLRKKSRSVDLPSPSEAESTQAPDLESKEAVKELSGKPVSTSVTGEANKQNKKEPGPQKSSAAGVSIQPAQNIAAEKGKTSPTKPRIDSRSLSLDFVIEEDSASQQSSVQPGTLIQKDKPMPLRRKSRSVDLPSPSDAESTQAPDLESKEAVKELLSGKPSSAEKVVSAVTEKVAGKPEVLPPKRGPKGELVSSEQERMKGIEKPESPMEEVFITKEIKVLPIKAESKKDPDCQKPTSTPETVRMSSDVPVAEKGLIISAELATTKLKTSMKDPESQKKSPTSEVVTATAEVSAKERGKLSPTKGKPKDVKLPEKKDTQEKKKPETQMAKATAVEKTKGKLVRKTSREEPDSEKPPLSQGTTTKPTISPIARRGKLSLTKEKSKSVDVPESPTTELTKAKKELSSTPDLVTALTETIKTTVVEQGKLSPTKGMSKDKRPSLELAKAGPTKTKDRPDSQKPSTLPGVVTAKTEATVKEKGKTSPTKERSKGLKLSPDLAATRMTKTKQEPDRQKPSPTKEVVKPTEIAAVEKGELSPTKRRSIEDKGKLPLTKDQPTPSSKLVTTEFVSLIKEPKSLESSITTIEQTKATQLKEPTIPARKKSKGLDVSKPSEPVSTIGESKTEASTEATKADLAKGPTQMTVVGKGMVLPTKTESKSLLKIRDTDKSSAPQRVEPFKEGQTTLEEVSPVSKKLTLEVSATIQELPGKKVATFILDTPDSFPPAADTTPLTSGKSTTIQTSVLVKADTTTSQEENMKPVQERKGGLKETSEQTITMSVEKVSRTVPQTGPTPPTQPTDKPHDLDTMDRLEKDTTEIQQRYLVLDLPDTGSTQTSKSKPDQQDSIWPTSAGTAGILPMKTEKETSSFMQDITKLAETVSQQILSKMKPGGLKEEKAGEVSTTVTRDAPKGQEEKPGKKEETVMEPQVRVLELDIPTDPEKKDKSVPKAEEPKVDAVPIIVESKTLPAEMVLTFADGRPEKTDVTAQKPDAMPKKPGVISEKDVTPKKADVMQQKPDVKTQKADAIQKKADVISKKVVLESTPREPKKEKPSEGPTSESQEEKLGKMEEIKMEPQVRVLQLDIPTDLEQKDGISIQKEEEPKVESVQTRVEHEPLPGVKVVTSAKEKPEKTDVPLRSLDVTPEETDVTARKSDVMPKEADITSKKEKKAQAETSVERTEKLVLEEPEGSAMRNIFKEIQLRTETGPSSPVIEGKPQEDAPEGLITPTSDLDSRLNRLVSKVLSCKNQPAELSPTAMAQQLEEAQKCKETAEEQISLLAQLRGSDVENKDALEQVEDQWNTVVQDVTAAIESKEAQLRDVTDYCMQTKAAETMLEDLTVELDAVNKSPEEGSSKEAERLRSLQRSIEEKRPVLGKLLMTHTKLCPHLSRSEQATAQTEHKNLRQKWKGMERDVERSLYHTDLHSQETGSLLSEISNLQEHLKTTGKDLEVKCPSGSPWNCKKAQQLMVANAGVRSAQQKYLHLQQELEALLLSSHWEKENRKIKEELQKVKDQLRSTEEQVSSKTQNSSNPIMEKIIVVMRDGLAWAKQTETDIEGRRKRIALLPEEVHQQLRDLKKLQSEVLAKQGQLESLVEEVTELLPQLDQAEEVPMVRESLESLEELSKSTTEKLAKAVRETESGLQTREKLSEQVADLDSWVVAHLHREASRSVDSELKSPAEFDRRIRQIQDTLSESEKQAAVCEALLMKSKDISSELSITENCQLFDELTNLQEDIRAISSYEKTNKQELDELTQTIESSKTNLVTTEKSLKQMLVDLNKHRFPITKESLQALEPFKQMILENKSQVDLLQPWLPQEKSKELYSIITELHNKIASMEMKAKDHEGYLNMRQCLEDLRENVQEQVHKTKDDSRDVEEKYKLCQTLLVQFPLMRYLSKEANSKLQVISADLYPSQLNAERLRLKQNEDSNDKLEMTLYNNLSIVEGSLLKELDLDTERKATRAFLQKTQQDLQSLPTLEPNDTVIDGEYRRIMSLKKTVESRMRALEVLEQKKGNKEGSGSQDLMVSKRVILNECDKQMVDISKARESLRNYTTAVRQAAQFLRDIEVSLLPPYGSGGLCSERVEETQQALASLQQQFQIHVEQLQSQSALHPHLSPQKVEQLQENILSQLLVRMSTLQAKGHVQLDRLSRCAENYRKYTKCQEEVIKSTKSAENSLSQFIGQKVTCLADCNDQQAKLKVLSDEVESLLKRLEELREWCPEQSCCGGREAAVTALWKRLARLRRCTLWLTIRCRQRVIEWSDVTNSVEKASAVLDQVEAELPDSSRIKASTEELQDLLQSWEQYQDRLDCEHRALSALELRTARLLSVPSHLEQAPPIPICQKLQAMQGRYNSVTQRSRQGLEAARIELEEKEKIREELQSIKVWQEAATGVLTEMEKSGGTQQLQEVHSQLFTQKALLQRIMETLRIKYSDVYSPVPPEIDGQLKGVTQSLQKVELKVRQTVDRSGPVHKLAAKLCEIQAGLRSVQRRLEQRSPTVTEAKVIQKRAWDELDVWHSCMAALEVDMQDLEKPEEALSLTERLVEVQQLHSQLAKQAEQRTTLLSKTHMWLQEHREMIKSSKSWMSEAQTWLASPCTYTTSKDLSSHVQALQTVLNDSAQIRSTLQGFTSVLKEMSQVCDVTALQEQLIEADHEVENVQDNFTAPLSHLEHAAAEVEAIESEVKKMENNVADIKTLLTSPESFPSPREESLKAVEKRIQSMRRTIAEIQKCKPGLCLPEKAEETLVVFSVVDQLQNLLLELEKKVPALFIQQPPTPVQAKAPTVTSQPELLKSQSKEEKEKGEGEQGQIRIAHVEEDVLRRSGAALLSVEHSSAEQRKSWTAESTKESMVLTPEESEGASGETAEQAEEALEDVEGPTDTTPEASSSEALSKPVGTVRTQSLPESMVNPTATVKISKPESQQKCVVS
ncbi:LOW QUALITY PROTEIN: nesprin-2 [Xyrichtys novacula]|uniref:LOW QUALITY PROTEIN: nesprin-2 n=1 Tax=Xyrichtys novacula TaxID=13765 RepID=A0AAV1GKN1_XYRNO|nr:LOW QUALITY PROTEIN: nesprin-2 [Xyrichtys novacula]